MNDFYVILTASLVAINCALMGSFLVMRKMVMIGDAISHAVLPGIFFAYLISGSTANLAVLAGAALSGILATVLIEWLTKKVRLQNDASIGISYTFLFAIGVILISRYGQSVDLDQECVLYGDIELTVLNLSQIGTWLTIPYQAGILFTVMLILLAAVIIGYKGLLITTFDPAFALSSGVSIGLWHYILMSGVSLTTVVSFDSVGAILVISFLSGPPAIAYLLTEDLKKLIVLSCFIGVLCSILGYYFAKYADVSISGAIALVIGLVFTLVFLIQNLVKSKQAVISLK